MAGKQKEASKQQGVCDGRGDDQGERATFVVEEAKQPPALLELQPKPEHQSSREAAPTLPPHIQRHSPTPPLALTDSSATGDDDVRYT